MTFEVALFIFAGAIFGGFVNGLAGFGTSLFALGWWLQVMDPVDAVALSLAISMINGIQGVWLVRRSIDKRSLARFLLPALIGIPVGLTLLDRIEAEPLQLLTASFLLSYGAFFAFRRNLPTVTRPTPIIDSLIGFLGGLFGALAGLSGAFPTVWLSLRPWPKAKTRGVLQPFNTVVLGLAALLLVLKGTYDASVLLALALAIPVALASAQVGITAFKRINDADFRRLLVLLMLVSGVVLLGRSVF
ncbi:MAG: sulfite exporter TauE/SafE family protein [Geminicoccaceae bacterium]